MKGLDANKISVNASSRVYAITYTSWNSEIVGALFESVSKKLLEYGINEKNILSKEVPGAFELPLASKNYALKDNVDVVIALGAIIRGDTPHFDYISKACIEGLMIASLETNKPIVCGVLTTDDIAQAQKRSDPSQMNKGSEFALTALHLGDSLKS
jgi:6,7-dimethyl-8-ribityllumazine synthase